MLRTLGILPLKLGSNHLQIMMMRLVFIMSHVDIPVKRSGTFQEAFWGVLQPVLHELFGKRFTEAQVVDDVGYVGHVCGEVVSFGLGLDVEVARSTVDLKEAGEHAAWMVFVVPGVFDFVT